MLSERVCQLLTAYVDGELNGRQRRAVERLLRDSAEARAVCEQLRQAAGILRSLPPRTPGQDLSGPVLRTIAERRLHPARRAAPTRYPAFPAWVGLATAAGVLFLITVASFIYFSALPDHKPKPVARTKPTARSGEGRPTRAQEERVAAVQPDHGAGDPKPPADPPSVKPAPAVPDKAPAPAPKPAPAPPQPTALASPERPDPAVQVFEVPDLRTALHLSMRSLDEAQPRLRLRTSLKTAGAYRAEITAANGPALGRLRSALEGQGIQVLVDRQAGLRLANPRLRTDYVLYCECLTADEWAGVLERLGQADRKAEAQKRGAGTFAGLVVQELGKRDHARLSELLGVDPTALGPAAPKAPLGVDIRKPIEQGTADQVARTLAGQGIRRPTDRQAVVLALNPQPRRPSASREVQQFLAGRKERRPGAVQVLLILRGANG